MNIKYVAVIVTLCLAIVFLGLDKCGSSRKVDELKGQYEEASRIAEVERRIKEETIKEQQEKIGTLDATIVVLNTTVAKKERSIAGLDGDVLSLERSFAILDDKDEMIASLETQVSIWKQKFSLAQSIISDKDAIIFSLSQKYESQVIISLEYKSMDEASRKLLDIRDKQVKELENINRRLKLTSKVKTGVVIGCALLVLYNMVK